MNKPTLQRPNEKGTSSLRFQSTDTVLIKERQTADNTENENDELEILALINRVRTKPKEFGEYLESMLPHFNEVIYISPTTGYPNITREGTRAVLEAAEFLKNSVPIPALRYSPGLSLAARSHCKDIGPKGTTGHQSSNGQNTRTRISKFGRITGTTGENIAFGNSSALDIVTQLIIDDGVESRGHRENIMNKVFKVCGIGVGKHKTYKTMCTIDFAGGFIDDKESNISITKGVAPVYQGTLEL